MKKLLLTLISMLFLIGIAYSDEITPIKETNEPIWCFMVKDNKTAQNADFKPGMISQDYPFTYNSRNQVVGLYKDKDNSLLLCHSNDFSNTYYAGCIRILSTKYMQNKSTTFVIKYKQLIYITIKMDKLIFLNNKEFSHLYDLIKTNRDKSTINKLSKLNQDKLTRYIRLLKKGSQYSNRIKQRYDLIESNKLPNDYLKQIIKIDSGYNRVENKQGNDILFEITRLESTMQQNKDACNTILINETSKFNKYISENRPAIDKHLMDIMISVIKKREITLNSNNQPINYNITKEVTEELDNIKYSEYFE